MCKYFIHLLIEYISCKFVNFFLVFFFFIWLVTFEVYGFNYLMTSRMMPCPGSL